MTDKTIKKTKAPKKETSTTPNITREENGNITLEITIPVNEVEAARKKVVDNLVNHVEIPGFRKGKAPRAKAEARLNKNTIKEETLKLVLPDAYNKEVQKAGINPIMNPQVHIEVFEEGTDLKVKAVTAEAPEVKLNDYKDKVKAITASTKIIKPGEENQEKKPDTNAIVTAALDATEIKIPQILIDQEVTRLLSQLLDELKTIGLTLDQYLTSRNLDGDKIREEYKKKAELDLKLEFMLRKIGDEEKITVTEQDVEDALKTITDEKQRAQIASNPYLVVNVIRQQKTLDYLTNL